VAGRRQEQINPQDKATEVRHTTWEYQNQYSSGEKSSERKRVRKSPVPPEIAITDTKAETNNIEIRNHSAERSGEPHTIRNARAIETGADADGSDRV